MAQAEDTPPVLPYEQFRAVDIRAGTVLAAEPLAGARRPALTLVIDFGPSIGRKTSSAQITRHYRPQDLIGRQVVAVVNFAPKRIGRFVSEVLVLGLPDAAGEVVLLRPDQPVPDGARVY